MIDADGTTRSTQTTDKNGYAYFPVSGSDDSETTTNKSGKAGTITASDTGDTAKSAFLAQTGDPLSSMTMTLYAICAAAFMTCIVLFILARKRAREEEEQYMVEQYYF